MTNRFLVNTHYPMPWIIWKQNHSITVPQFGHVDNAKLAHGLPFIPLVMGQWSANTNFSPSYDISIEIPGGNVGGQPETAVLISADGTNINFSITNNTSQRTFYFRLMAFAPPDYTGEVTPVTYSSVFRFNSKYRYQQLFMSGLSSSAVNHNLGYIPQAKVWSLANGMCSPAKGIITENTLQKDGSGQFYYHIYKD